MEVSEALSRIAHEGPYVQFCWSYLARQGSAPLVEIHQASKADWWLVKTSLELLKRMDVIEPHVLAGRELWRLTVFGKRVRDAQAPIRTLGEV